MRELLEEVVEAVKPFRGGTILVGGRRSGKQIVIDRLMNAVNAARWGGATEYQIRSALSGDIVLYE